MVLKTYYQLWTYLNRPDNISARILSNAIAPVIFTQSLNSGNLPEDWLIANITPVFKKGDRPIINLFH